MASVTYVGTRKLAGDVLGDNLISNWHFTSGTAGWTGRNSGTISKTADGRLRVTNGAAAAGFADSGPITVEAGALYRVDVEHAIGTSSTSQSMVSTTATAGDVIQRAALSTSGADSYYFVPAGTSVFVMLLNGSTTSGQYSDFDNVRVRKVLARGHATSIEHVINGRMSPDSQWTKGAGWAIGSGVATATAGSASTLKNALGLGLRYGKAYDTSITIGGTPASFIALYLGDFVAADQGTQRSTASTFTEQLIAGVDSSGNSNIIIGKSSTGAGTVDNVSVKLASGNTWSQDFGIQYGTYSSDRRFSRDSATSLDRSAIVYTYDGAETFHTFTTKIQDYQAIPFMDEWLASVEDGTQFTFDLYGTADEPQSPITVTLESAGKQPAGVVGGRPAFRYQITLREA